MLLLGGLIWQPCQACLNGTAALLSHIATKRALYLFGAQVCSTPRPKPQHRAGSPSSMGQTGHFRPMCGPGAGSRPGGSTRSSQKAPSPAAASHNGPLVTNKIQSCSTGEPNSTSRTSAQGLCASTQTLIQLQPCFHGFLRGSKKMMA